jgi:hypothetical protein
LPHTQALFWTALAVVAAGCTERNGGTGGVVADRRVRVGILGDSDSHSYHDSVLLADPSLRGGDYRPTTFQWTEVWSRLRPDEVDLGEWGVWGTRGRLAAALRAIGWNARAPRKQDYRFNLAVSGAPCGSLTGTRFPQAGILVELMNREPERWAQGVVVIRIGINSLGKVAQMDEFAARGLSATARGWVRECVTDVDAALRLIRARHAATRVVLVGILDNADWARNRDRWQDATALANISTVLDAFDDELRALAAADPRTAFLDDRAWFRRTWGGRGPDGHPAYREVSLGGPVSVTNSTGDHPRHVAVQDGHFGTVANGLWLGNLIDHLEGRWSLGLSTISPAEVASLADPDGRLGIRAVPALAGGAR